MIGVMQVANITATPSFIARPLLVVSLATVGLLQSSGCSAGQSPRNETASQHEAAASPSAQASSLASALRAFVQTLSNTEKTRALRAINDAERTEWIFVRGDRPGLFLRDMDAETRAAALTLVDVLLSASGREQWRLIRVMESINGHNEKVNGGTSPSYGEDLYAMILFGSPDADAWAVQLEGHHFVLNVAFVHGVVTVTPAFTGAYPVAIASGADAGKRPLGAAVNAAFDLANALSASQRATARILDGTPADVLFSVGSDAKSPDMRGVNRRDMNAQQQELVDKLLASHAGLLAEEVASAQLRRWREEFNRELTFAFVGDTDLGKPHYYRLTSPCFTIEYDCTNGDANHVHCVWSDPSNNFGGDALRAHLHASH